MNKPTNDYEALCLALELVIVIHGLCAFSHRARTYHIHDMDRTDMDRTSPESGMC